MDKQEKEESKRNDYYVSELESYIKILRANKDYSMQRFDVLIISISGAGVYTSFEFMKFISTSTYFQMSPDIQNLNIYYKITGVVFTLSIIANFFSQWTSYRSTSMGIEATKGLVFKIKEMDVDEKKTKKYQSLSDKLNKVTSILNFVTMFLMSLALVLMIFFTWFIF